MYFYNKNLSLDILPWIYSNEANNVFYIMTFTKVPDVIQASLYEAFYTGNVSDIFSNYDANQFLQFPNLQKTVFTNTLVNWSNTFVFTGNQLGAANLTCLYYLRQAYIYNYNANNSFYEDGNFGLQIYNFTTNEGGLISLPNAFTLDKNSNSVGNNFSYNNEPFLYFLMGLNNASLSQGLILLQTNPAHGFVSNKTHTLTTNTVNTFVGFLPGISISTTGNTVYNDFTRQQFLNIQVNYANGSIYNEANTEISIDATQGYVSSKKIVTVNSVANVGVTGLLVSNGQVITYRVGWPNYANVATANITVLNSPANSFTVPGTYTWPCPLFNTLTVTVIGAGGGGGSNTSVHSPNFGTGANGTNSSFNTTVVGGGGKAGDAAGDIPVGGTASGGDTNQNGLYGYAANNFPPPPPAGAAGGGDLLNGASSGSGGGATIKTYLNNALSGNITIVVGLGGANGGTNANNGSNGAVYLSWS